MDNESQRDKIPEEKTYKNIFIAGIEEKLFDITISGGYFTSVKEAEGSGSHNSSAGDSCRRDTYPDRQVGQEHLWISPGVIDLHTHLAWTDFDMEDQLKREALEIEIMQAQAFEATLSTGVTTVRDAGGLLPDTARYISKHYGHPLRVLACGGMLGKKDAKGPVYLEQQVKKMHTTGAKWIKIFATGGLGAPPDQVLQPLLSKEEFDAILRGAHANNIKVMVHTWGGITIDWAVEAGADSVEHGVYLTEKQAEGLARSGIPYIPTTAIYRIAADKNGALRLGQVVRDRAARAALAHSKAVGNAKNAGVKIAFGTDFATPALHGNNLEEIDTLTDCGLTRTEAWQAATKTAAEIIGYGERLGRIEEGFTADAILFRTDPLKEANAKRVRESIVAVIIGTKD